MSNSTKVAVTQIIDILGLFFAGFPEIVGSVKVGPSDFLSGSQKSNLVEESRTVSFVAIQYRQSSDSSNNLRLIYRSPLLFQINTVSFHSRQTESRKRRMTEDQQEANDIFLSHNWGPDSLGRDNHTRVKKLNEALKAANMKTWFDADRLHGHVCQSMTEGIDNSEKVAVFITERYIDKVAQMYGLDDTCRQEYEYSVTTKGIKNIIPIVMEPQCRDLRKWHGSIGATLANQMFIDFSEDDKLLSCVEGILDHFDIQGREVLQLESGIYRGCLNDDWQSHGFGSMEYKNRSHYEGSWVNGKRSGKGRLTHALGFTYEGDFRDDKKDGFGILTMKVRFGFYE